VIDQQLRVLPDKEQPRHTLAAEGDDVQPAAARRLLQPLRVRPDREQWQRDMPVEGRPLRAMPDHQQPQSDETPDNRSLRTEPDRGQPPHDTTVDGRPVRVMLADDQPLLRRSLAMVIDNAPDLTVVGQAADGVEAIDLALAGRPDVVLMDVRMPRLDGLRATRQICAAPELAATRVVVLSMFELDEYVYEALQAGASGFLLKDARPQELVAAVRRTHRGESLFAPSILTRLIAHYVTTPPAIRAGPPPGQLTGREIEVLTLVGEGLSNDQIAARLVISIKTVKTHISHLLTKLGARDRAQLVIAAYDAALVLPRRFSGNAQA
jgi:DNA-binding NarL/FixJ family response regulator